ncbi:MAG TPA: glutamyl-tRNA reductase [Polyangiaceae bacterium]
MITVVGLSHKSAPIEVREQFALATERIPDFLLELVGRPEVGEALLVSTCNRVELLAAARAGSPLERVGDACRSALLALAPAQRGNVLYEHHAGAAVRHLFNVASSLDSLVLGEPQILGQVKDAYELARKAGTVGAVLHRTLARAIHTAKLVRAQTQIGSGQVSVPTVAADLARRIFGDLGGHSVLLVGSGEMAEAVARLLQSSGADLFVIGRTPEKVRALAESVGGRPRAWSDLAATLPEVDVVITSTSARNFVIDREVVNRARRSRRGRSQFYIDLAVPRDVDPAIDSLDGVFLYNIDDFSRVVAETLASRARESERAQSIIDGEAKSFDRWADAEQATPTVVALRSRIRAALRAELGRSLNGRLRHLGAAERAALETMLEASVNRILHQPTTRLRQAASLESLEAPGFPELCSALERLFALNEEGDEGLDAPPSGPAYSSPDHGLQEATPDPNATSGEVMKLGSR